MRTAIDAREFASVGTDTFRLDANARRWIRERLLGGVPPSASATAGFSYVRR